MKTKPKLTRWPIPLLDRLKACAAAEGVPMDRIVHIAVQQYIERSEARRGVGGQP